ncbi:MAG: hypothetical protein ACK5MT_11630 [Actinomycetales bacterium]
MNHDDLRTLIAIRRADRATTTPRPVQLEGVLCPNGQYLATAQAGHVRVVGLGADDRDDTISAWRATLTPAGFGPFAVSTLLLVRRDVAGVSHLSVWTPGAGARDIGASFDGDVDAWWASDGRVLVRGVGPGPGGTWVVDPYAGEVVAA